MMISHLLHALFCFSSCGRHLHNLDLVLLFVTLCRVIGLPRRAVAGDRVGIAGARSGAKHSGLIGVGGPRHPGEPRAAFVLQPNMSLDGLLHIRPVKVPIFVLM